MDLLLHSALHIGELQLKMQTLAWGSFGDLDGHWAGQVIFLRKHGLLRLGQVTVSALICTKTETKMSRPINKLLLETFMLEDTKNRGT